MKLEQFLKMYEDRCAETEIKMYVENGIIVSGRLDAILGCIPMINGVENYSKLFKMKVVSFVVRADKLYVGVR